MDSQQVLIALTALNTAGILPAAWALVKWVFRTEQRLLALEMRAGIKAPAEVAQ